ncbi:MAG: ATP-dependent helicase C-terminal domain-containing protein [Elusimicrobiota bacterium]|nr:ATP-dependent helicase C-terminal domain-containing protein [Elusimicrobiota bacterium]
MNTALPIHPFRERIVSELLRAGALVLGAPTGSGKSTQTPQFLLGKVPGRILVLEPRRLSARSLAGRVATECATRLGAKVGYQVRFDSACGPDTAVVFQTYGVFLARMLKDPSLAGVGAVLLDEFHERTLECDLALGWLKALRAGARKDLKVAVMSATLEAEELLRFLPDAARIEVPGRLFPVAVSHHPLAAREEPGQGALAALKELARAGLDGSVLVFMPGLREIRRAMTALAPYCREQGLELHALHGGMELAEQGRVLEESSARRVIVATNVAETGLTVPGVTAVIDSGLHRVAAYDAARGINTLYVSRVSRGNADQRAGRAGRTAPGRCVRLWSKADEAGMAPRLKPEVLRLELSAARLQAASLPGPVEWVTPPHEAAWNEAGRALAALGAADADGRITPLGRALLRYPAPPRVAAVLEASRAIGPEAYERACAMAAVFETAGDRRPDATADLSALAADLLAGSREETSWEAVEAFRQLKRLYEDDGARSDAPDALTLAWLAAFGERLAAREGEGLFYRMGDGRGVTLAAAKPPPELILALEVRERAGGGQARQTGVSLYLPLSADALLRSFPNECVWTTASGFDERKGRVVKEERLLFRGLVLKRKESATVKSDRRAAADIWAEKFASGELRHPGFDEKVPQYLVRLAVARRLYPDMGFPELGPDDWRLIYGEVCAGKNSLKDIEKVPLLPHLAAYLGPALAGFLDRVLPEVKKLPSGRVGRFTYHETRPAELSARLGDFVGLKGTLALCEGRLPVVFDVLAPNHRTVQKTSDLSSFWANAYPTVKKELQRRYPRHPWP